ncbi:hypothetical protein BH10ACI1_BH10ACI1_01660 [soil metagenome]
MNVQDFFINRAERLRSGWRFVIFLLAFFFFGAIFGGAAVLVLSALKVEGGADSVAFILVSDGISLILAILLDWLCGKFFEDLPFRALGASFDGKWLKDFAFGLLIGAVSIGFAVLIAAAAGGLSFSFNQTQGTPAILLTLGVSFGVFAVAAAFEEAFFRGYILQTFSRADLAWLAIVLTSVFFAAVHLQNSGANYFSTINTALAGIWFGVAYLKTRNLWFPFGIHLAWNWMQGAVFGIEVSGITSFTNAPLFRETDIGPAWLTGGDYGIEGGIACTLAIIFSTALIYFLPILKPTGEMLALTSEEKTISEISKNNL